MFNNYPKEVCKLSKSGAKYDSRLPQRNTINYMVPGENGFESLEVPETVQKQLDYIAENFPTGRYTMRPSCELSFL